MAIDHFLGGASLLTSPPEHAFDITPDDDADLPAVTRAIYVGGGGDLCVQTKAGDIVTYRNLGTGSLKPGRYARVLETGTTATDLVGEY